MENEPMTTNAEGWTLGAYVAHNEAVRAAEERFDVERDRRYAEVATEREKALKIKETADLAALGLAREIQTYKDEKANELRSQIERERGTYATKDDLQGAVAKIEVAMQPLVEFVQAQRGRQDSRTENRQTFTAVQAVVVAVVSALFLFLNYQVARNHPVTTVPVVTVTTPTAP